MPYLNKYKRRNAMFLLIVGYTQSPEQVTVHAPAHAEWIKQYIEEGIFLFAGPKKSKLES
jgi:uncharacterized protein YciI